MKVMFVLWGGLGLLMNILAALILVVMPNVGVGTSAYNSALTLVWIGGMVFFGLGSLVFRKPSPAQVAPPAQRDSDIIESYFAAPKTPVAPRAPVAMPRQLFANMD